MKLTVLALLLLIPACTYNLDTPAMNDLRERMRAMEASQASTGERMNAIEQRQNEQERKINLMWTHGK